MRHIEGERTRAVHDPNRHDAILERLTSIDTQLAMVNTKIDKTDARLRRVEDAIGPVEWLTKVTDIAAWRGARGERANLVTIAREAALEVLREVGAAFRPSRDTPDPSSSDGEPPAANSASLDQARRRRVQIAAACAVILLAVTLTYAAWEPEQAGNTRDLPVPPAPQPAPPTAAPITPTMAPSPTPGSGDTQPPEPSPGLLGPRPGLLPTPTGHGQTTQDPPALVLGPSGSPAVTSSGGCSGLGVQVRRIELCRRRP